MPPERSCRRSRDGREREPEAGPNQLVQPSDTERLDLQPLGTLGAYRSHELPDARHARLDPDRGDEPDGLSPQTPQRELEHVGGRDVEPLEVVDGTADGPAPCQGPQRRQRGGADDPLVRLRRRLAEQQDRLERSPLHRRERVEYVLRRRGEQIGETGEREGDLCFARAGDQDGRARGLRALDRGLPRVVFPTPASPSRKALQSRPGCARRTIRASRSRRADR